MSPNPVKPTGASAPDVEDADLAPRSIYDPADEDEEGGGQDLWFLPPEPLDEDPDTPPFLAPLRRAAAPRLGPSDWVAAEAACGRALAEAAAAWARLDERLQALPQAANRLAIQNVSAALEAQGDWLPLERIALYIAMRESAGEDGPMLSAADWAIRRALSPLDPLEDLPGFLGRHPGRHDGLSEADSFGALGRPEEFEATSAKWSAQMEDLGREDLHELTRAGATFHIWQSLGLSAPGAVLEATSVAGAALCSQGRGRALTFCPAALGARADLLAHGDATRRLLAWLQALKDGCARALLEAARLSRWQESARIATEDLSGRTPPLILDALARFPVASADMLARQADASPAAIRRNMAELTRRGLVREATGQSRFRFWAAKIARG